MNEDDKCSICMGDFGLGGRGAIRYPHVNEPGCNYRVHRACLDRFMDSNVQEDLRCPACRDPIRRYRPPVHVLRRLIHEEERNIPQRQQDEELLRQINQQDFEAYQRDLAEAGIENLPSDLQNLRDEVWMYNMSNEWTAIIEQIRQNYNEETERQILNRIRELYNSISENPDIIPQYEDMVEDVENHINPYTRFLNEQAREIIAQNAPNRVQ
jgi:Txe/YoeB family toxin of Txe-Axe toxin-antitoxin module